MDAADRIVPGLLGMAVLLPLASFWLILVLGRWMGKHGEYAAFVAAGAIVAGFVLSLISAVLWFSTMPASEHHAATTGAHANEHGHDQGHDQGEAHVHAHDDEGAPGEEGAAGEAGEHHHPAHPSRVSTGNWYTLAKMGSLELTIGYYVDSLTVIMFCMVTLIASCIHFYAMGYMHDELHEIVDHEVHLSDGHHLRRPGRYHRFFQYLSLFCFSMLGLVVAGNIAMTFVFWELVGICSYFLIGFYVERRSASTAANKAFIVNRVGDFGFIIGLMAIWSTLGTFNFGDIEGSRPGIFSSVRPGSIAHSSDAEDSGEGESATHHGDVAALIVPDEFLKWGGANEIRQLAFAKMRDGASQEAIAKEVAHLVHEWKSDTKSTPYRWAYWLMIVAGIGVFLGCVGKSAQFPLHTWLPDAMEGPTPVSALVHSATMVAAGVYLTGRFYPFFLPEVLLTIAIIGCITLFMAATIAIVATDIKRVLAYSTVSQLGYMMLALGVGGWTAGLMHLITHAFFKSLLFMCSGSVIHAVHTNEMPQMGGLIKKMPITGWTMFIGCLAIAGAGIPFALPLLGWVGLSGFYSKDAILEQAWLYGEVNKGWRLVFFFAAAGGAAITAFYMFRMWFMTFTGEPRDHHRYDHAHESPSVMTMPLIICSIFAVAVAWPIFGLQSGLESARHLGTLNAITGDFIAVTVPDEHLSHADRIKVPVTWLAFGTAVFGIGLAAAFYWKGFVNPAEVRQQFGAIYTFLRNKWYFDELYDFIFVRPTMIVSRLVAGFDRRWIDGFIDGLGRTTVWFTKLWDLIVDRRIVDGSINTFAHWTYSLGDSLREVQTGKLRQYVMFIVVATVAIFVLLVFFSTMSFAQ
jgi:NADH-quinone oxidoreductase subunit L